MKLVYPPGLRPTELVNATRELRQFTAPDALAARRSRKGLLGSQAQWEKLWWGSVVVGYAIADKQTDNRRTHELCVRVYVTSKLPKRKLKSSVRIPSFLTVLGRNGNSVKVRTDVIELKSLPHAHRTVFAGDSLGHSIGTRGTLGVAVADSDGNAYALTCGHVAAPFWVPAKAGDDADSPADSGGQAGPDTMGALADWVVLEPSGINTVDAALIQAKAGVHLSNQHLALGPSPSFANLTIDQYIKLRSKPVVIESQGGALDGVIDAIHNDLPVDIGNKVFRFSDVFSYTADVAPGDSGSAVIDAQSREILGIHFAGIPSERTGYGITSRQILRAFQAYGLRPLT